MTKNIFMVALIPLLAACGGHIAEHGVGEVSAAGTTLSPVCARVKMYYDALASEDCEPYLPPPSTYDDASCNQASVDLDFCYSDPTCWLAVQQKDVATCRASGEHTLLPQWEASN